MTRTWNAYHFVGETLRDGRPVPADGETLRHDGPLKLCSSGLHASRKAWQAAAYGYNPILCRVHCGGEIIEEDDKLVCRERTIVARIDATDLLREYARSCASDVLHLWDAPDVVREYLVTGNEHLREATNEHLREATRDAANSVESFLTFRAIHAAFAAARSLHQSPLIAATTAALRARLAAVDDISRNQRIRFSAMVNHAFREAGK